MSNSLSLKQKLQLPMALQQDEMSELDFIVQNAEQRAQKMVEKEFKTTPEIIASVTGAKRPIKIPVKNSHDSEGDNLFGGSGNFMDIMMRMLQRRTDRPAHIQEELG